MPKLNLSHKPNSQIEKLRSEYTQRPSYNSHTEKDKENIKNRLSESENIPKSIVEKNNGVLINEINTFRLLFKILEKLRRNFSGEDGLMNSIGGEILKKVTKLKKCCEEHSDEYSIISAQKYFDEKVNPSIRKYKSVIREYFKKYTEEIKVVGNSKVDLKKCFQEFLQKKGSCLKDDD